MARPREEPSTTHPNAVSAAPSVSKGSIVPPFGASSSKPPLYPASARAPEPPTAPEPAKITELPKPATGAGTSLPSISNLDAPPQPSKETAGEAQNGANGAPASSVGSTAKPNGAAAAPATTGLLSTLNKPVEAVAPALSKSSLSATPFPRPVEVKSVPDTPVNTGTPAGGTPRPVLDISQEPIQKPVSESAKSALTAINETTKPESSLNGAAERSAPAPTSAPATATTGSSAPASHKRKLEDDAETRADSEQSEKKAKLEEGVKSEANCATDAAASAPASSSAPRKVGRPKKSKTPAPVGRTQRKTRSQGNVEGGL
ncbi:hypothetical protein A9K55_001440 [Cordyceps militaris]|uniref:Uncharacterized protein n=1 Tax=Cordyceps militaris TaxID=73501 RepID=A0A2H4ST28_CORMI|nr:hypothetical protein A9K55_001440 [Cordyceps militaris]